MSSVCNIVLMALDGINSNPIQILNMYLNREGHGRFEEISKGSGGFKSLETNLYAVACNNINLHDFIKLFKEQEFAFPYSVCLMVKDEHDDEWSKYSAQLQDSNKNYEEYDLMVKEAIIKKAKQLRNAPPNARRIILVSDDIGGKLTAYTVPNEDDLDDIDLEKLKMEDIPTSLKDKL